MDEWHFIADRKIREAMREGAFDGLEGMGAPLDLSENPFEDPAQRMAHRLMRNNGFAPAWLQESRDLDAEIRLVQQQLPRATPAERKRLLEHVNRRIADYNLKVPAVSLQKFPVQLDKE